MVPRIRLELLASGGRDLGHRPPCYLGSVFRLQADQAQDALGEVAVGVLGGLSAEHGPHHGQQRAAGCEQRDLLVGDLEPPGSDAPVEVVPGEWAERGE